MNGACDGCGAFCPGDADRCPLCGVARTPVLSAAAPVSTAPPAPSSGGSWLPYEPVGDHPPPEPTAWAPAPAVALTADVEAVGAARPATAWMLAGGAIALSLVFQLLSHHLQPGLHRTVATYLEIAVALTVLVYAVVAAATAVVVRSQGLRLRWTRGRGVVGALLGVGVGGAFGGVLLLHTQAVTGHVVVDPSITVQLSEDTWWATIVGMVLLVVVAPVVEEIVFRGVLAQSMLARSVPLAVLTSAPAFWLWHWRLSVEAFVLLAGFGAVLAVVYRRRGLVASMAAHATYNGILVAVVIARLAGPAHAYDIAGLSLSAPGSWQRATDPAGGLLLVGPSASLVEIDTRSLDHQPQVDELTERLRAATQRLTTGGGTVGAVTPVALPVGPAVQVVATDGVHHVTLTELAVDQVLYVVEVDDEGSATAARQAAGILRSLRDS